MWQAGEAYPRGVAPVTPMRHVIPIVCQSASPSVPCSRPIYHRDNVFVPVAWCRLLPSDLRNVLADSVQSL
jgi:hypothetical protein